MAERGLVAIVLLAMLLALAPAPREAAAEGVVEVLHPWSGGGKARGMSELRRQIEARGSRWIVPPEPVGEEDPIAALQARVEAGSPPTAILLEASEIGRWAERQALADLGSLARQESWDQLLPPQLWRLAQYDRRFVAVPLNIRRVNWLWANRDVLAKIDAGMPTSWAEFNALADKLKQTGITPLALGGAPWQTAALFEVVTLGFGGPEIYRKALVELDADTLRGPIVQGVFEQMRRLSAHVDAAFPDRDARRSAELVASGNAAFLVAGDWAKEIFLAVGKSPGINLLCAPAPGGAFIFDSDMLAFFAVQGEDHLRGRNLLASLALSEGFQETFNLLAGSIPARMGVPRGLFDGCAHQSMDDLTAAIRTDSLLPSAAHGLMLAAPIREAITGVVSAHFGSDMSSREAVDKLVAAVQEAARQKVAVPDPRKFRLTR
jgi:glucose/mannose transport system substrate-binding protein